MCGKIKIFKNVFRKIKARNRTHAVSMAFSLGILTTQLLTDTNNIFLVDGWNLYDILEEDTQFDLAAYTFIENR